MQALAFIRCYFGLQHNCINTDEQALCCCIKPTGQARSPVQGDVVGCLLDCDAGEVAYSLNGQALGPAFALPAHVRGRALHPAICLRNAEVAVNFGGAPFAHVPPPGYAGLAAAPAEWVRSGGGRSA